MQGSHPIRFLLLAVFLGLAALPARADILTPCRQADPPADPRGAIDACTPLAGEDSWIDAERSAAFPTMARAHTELGLNDQAQQAFLMAARLQQDPRALTDIAWKLHGAGFPAEAEGFDTRALKAGPGMTHAWLARCVIRQAREKRAASLPDGRRACEIWTGGEGVLSFLTRGFVMVDDPVNAVNCARYASQQPPGSARIWVLRVWALRVRAEEIAQPSRGPCPGRGRAEGLPRFDRAEKRPAPLSRLSTRARLDLSTARPGTPGATPGGRYCPAAARSSAGRMVLSSARSVIGPAKRSITRPLPSMTKVSGTP